MTKKLENEEIAEDANNEDLDMDEEREERRSKRTDRGQRVFKVGEGYYCE